MTNSQAPKKPESFLLHACCGPCSLEPVRLLREQGYEPVIYYANSNIAPEQEYHRRLDTLKSWAQEASVSVVEGPYDPQAWEEEVARPFETLHHSREERCRACYRLRFRQAAAYGKQEGFDLFGTTLSVSPYQYSAIIAQELEEAAATAGLQAAFEDYRPYYPEATRRAKEAGLYRQNYCGCRFSAQEAEEERRMRKAQRRAKKEAQRALGREAAEAELRKVQERRRERALYDEKQKRKHQILKELREQNRAKAHHD